MSRQKFRFPLQKGVYNVDGTTLAVNVQNRRLFIEIALDLCQHFELWFVCLFLICLLNRYPRKPNRSFSAATILQGWISFCILFFFRPSKIFFYF